MNESGLAEMERLIRQRLAEIEAEDTLGRDGQKVVVLDQQSVGRLSRMDALQNQAMAKAQQGRRSLEKRRLKRALDRMQGDDYGYCEDCGEDIPLPRLRLDPATQRCVSCASG